MSWAASTSRRSAPAPTDPRAGEVAALGSHGEMLASAPFRFDDGKAKAAAHIPLPLEVRNETTRLAIVNADAAARCSFWAAAGRGAPWVIVGAGGGEDLQPLLSDTYYLERALAPYAEVRKGTISDLLARNVSVLILADVGPHHGQRHSPRSRNSLPMAGC
ncbi:MAG: hypothetical protein WDN08_12815 [Rhizomicrobium sp.]